MTQVVMSRKVSIRSSLERWEFDLDDLDPAAVAMLRRAATITRRRIDTSHGIMVKVTVRGTKYYAEVFPSGFTLMKEKAA